MFTRTCIYTYTHHFFGTNNYNNFVVYLIIISLSPPYPCSSSVAEIKYYQMDEYCRKEMLRNQFAVGLYDVYDDHDENMDNHTTSSSSNRSSTSLSDLVDDDVSSSSSSSNGPLYELSDLMAQLPIKRGLSKYFQGKSQSFTSLSKVRNIEDLAKKENPYYNRRKMKACKSYGGGLDTHKLYALPKAANFKKASRGSLSFTTRRPGSFLGTTNSLPPLPAQKNF